MTVERVAKIAPVDRYPGFDVLSQQEHWDPATRQLLLDRVYNVPPIRFFGAHEAGILQAAIDVLLPQDDRPPERRVPIINLIDEGQAKGETAGFRYEDMPGAHTAWHWGLQGLDETARALYRGKGFADLAPAERELVLARLDKGDAPGQVWRRMPARRFFTGTLMGAIISAYYSHPFSWNEIGYGGPAYPRGYYALNYGVREHWEVDERP